MTGPTPPHPPSGAGAPPHVVDVVLVVSAACHLCEHAREILGRLSHEYPLTWREVDMASVEGAALVRELRVPFPPVLLVGGRYVAHGRLSERRLRRVLDTTLGRE